MRYRALPRLFIAGVALTLLAASAYGAVGQSSAGSAAQASASTSDAMEPSASGTLSLPDVGVAPGEELLVGLALELAAAELYSSDIAISYDPAVTTAVSVTLGTVVSAWSMASNLGTPWVIKVGIAGAQPLTSGGELLQITFQAVGDHGDSTVLALTRGDLNEGGLPATLEDGSLTIYSRCDIDDDCDIDVVDIMAVAGRWGCGCGDPCYDALYDLDDDCDIDVVDIMTVASRWDCECGDDCYSGAVGSAWRAGRP